MANDEADEEGDAQSNQKIPVGSDELRCAEKHASRKRGILTKKDRDFLCRAKDREDSNKQMIRDRRYRIRERISNSLKDFEILAKQLKPSDRRQVFESIFKSDESFLKEAGVFLYLGFMDLGKKASKTDFLENVIEDAHERQGEDIDVTVVTNHGYKEDGRPTTTVEIEFSPSSSSPQGVIDAD